MPLPCDIANVAQGHIHTHGFLDTSKAYRRAGRREPEVVEWSKTGEKDRNHPATLPLLSPPLLRP